MNVSVTCDPFVKRETWCPTWRSGPQGPLCGSVLWSCGHPWLQLSSSSRPVSPAAALPASDRNRKEVKFSAPQQTRTRVSVVFTSFSACLRRSLNRSSSWTQAGSCLWPCCLAFSICDFSSRRTRSSWSSRACRVRDTCRSNSRSREVRRRPSRLLTWTGGWRTGSRSTMKLTTL